MTSHVYVFMLLYVIFYRISISYYVCFLLFFFQAEDGIRDLVRSRGLGDVYKRQIDMQGTELQNYFHYLADEMKIPFKGGLSQKRRVQTIAYFGQGLIGMASPDEQPEETTRLLERFAAVFNFCLLYTSDAADERSSVDLGGRRIIKKKQTTTLCDKVR